MSIENRKARFDYTIIRTESCGLVLKGSEVKQLRNAKASLVDSFCYFINGELFVKSFLINETKAAFSHDPKRDKKLLLRKCELKKLQKELDKGMTIIPLRVYLSDINIFKMEIGLCKGKKSYDKKESLREKDILRDSLRDIQCR